MRYFYARKDVFCFWCKTYIQRGELVARASYTKIDKETGAKQNFGFCYHADPCYVQAFTDRYNRSLMHWRQQLIPPKKRGRPRRFTDPIKAQRLRCLLAYHKRTGNEDRVQELQAMLKAMELTLDK